MRNFGGAAYFRSQLSVSGPECNTVGPSTTPCVFPSTSSSSFSLCRFPVDTARRIVSAKGEERKWKEVGSIFASEGTVAGASSPALKNLSTRNHECLLATSPDCVPVAWNSPLLLRRGDGHEIAPPTARNYDTFCSACDARRR